ncbi:hypothetical protein [Methanoculleus chikugoensis]|uniref:hypothetical protein n=1 Tax=Methanoculleus chikugoensis TaxID=118126 RepID=UPI001FB3F16C|nr:hypothetical protein [Methanoculleus chikugoensis]
MTPPRTARSLRAAVMFVATARRTSAGRTRPVTSPMMMTAIRSGRAKSPARHSIPSPPSARARA